MYTELLYNLLKRYNEQYAKTAQCTVIRQTEDTTSVTSSNASLQGGQLAMQLLQAK